jgi:hypothetical protein
MPQTRGFGTTDAQRMQQPLRKTARRAHRPRNNAHKKAPLKQGSGAQATRLPRE